MVTVLRAHELRIVIFINDHLPAHVHVFGDGHAKIDLLGPGGTPDLVWSEGMTKAEMRRAMRMVIEQRDMLLAHWESIHGRLD